MTNLAGNLANSNDEVLKLLKKLQEEVNNLKTIPKAEKTSHVYVKIQTSTIGLMEHALAQVKNAKNHLEKMGTRKRPF